VNTGPVVRKGDRPALLVEVEMHSDEMSKFVEHFFMQANEVQWKKNADYHPDKVAFLEIMRTACETGISVEQDLWAKVRKQYVALRGYLIDGSLESEPPVMRAVDIAVYMGMIAFWDKNAKTVIRDALAFVSTKSQCENGRDSKCDRRDAVAVLCDRCRFLLWLEDRAAA
jgi:hypothetical protein